VRRRWHRRLLLREDHSRGRGVLEGHIRLAEADIVLEEGIGLAEETVPAVGSPRVVVEDMAVGNRLAVVLVDNRPEEVLVDVRPAESVVEEVRQSLDLEAGSPAADRSLDCRKT
jgi:hypothetical protein